MIWMFIVVALVGYFVGSIPTAWLVVRHFRGEGSDVRALGDGNVGATNAGRLLGARWGVFVGVLDMAKGPAVVLASNTLNTLANPGAIDQPVSTLGLLAGVAAVVGHVWPVWLGFRGGRGAATALGVAAAIIPGPMLVTTVPAALVLVRTRNTSLGFGCSFLWSLIVAKVFFGLSWTLYVYLSCLFGIVVLTGPWFMRREGSREWVGWITRTFSRGTEQKYSSYLPPNPSAKPDRLPPGPRELPIVGQTFRYLRDPIGLMEEAAGYGDLVTMSVKPWLVYLVNHPDLVRDVLVTNHHRLGRWRNVEAMKYLMGDGLLTADGSWHQRQRRLMQPAFHRRRIESMGDIMTSCASQRADCWGDGDRVDMDDEMRNVTLSIVIESLFNKNVSAEEVSRIGAAVSFANDYLDSRFHQYEGMRDMFHQLPMPASRKFKRELGFLDQVAYRTIEQRRLADDPGDDLLSMLLNMRGTQEDNGTRDHLTDRQIRDEIITIFAVGHETVTTALTWSWYLLATHPEVQSRFQSELDAVLGGRIPTVADLPNLVYTEQIITESMRLYPPVWRMGRVALEEFELGDYQVPTGALICVSQFISHHDSRWFDDPMAFRPERWTPEFRHTLHQYAYYPFGGGTRRCIGERFAWMEAKLIMATIGQQWDVRHDTTHRIGFDLMFTLRPQHGMPLFLQRR